MKKKKQLLKPEQNFKSYIIKVLKHVNSDMGIGRSSMSTMNSLVLEMYKKISKEAANVSRHGGRRSVTAADMQCAVKFQVPGELCKHAVSAGATAFAKYTKSREMDKKE